MKLNKMNLWIAVLSLYSFMNAHRSTKRW